ncbi:MAG: hypothetical protein ACO3EK_16795, partial [Alphaproteobacteria bacterium]
MEERAFADARRHAIYQIAHAPLRTYPFPHVFVEDVLPAAFYRRLLANLPGARAYDPDDGTAAERVEGRGSIRGARRGCNRMGAERSGFWTSAFEAFDHVEFGGWLTAKFYETIAGRLGLDNAAAHTDLDTRVRLVRDKSPASLRPHACVPGRVLTAVFQFARDDRRARRRQAGRARRAQGRREGALPARRRGRRRLPPAQARRELRARD